MTSTSAFGVPALRDRLFITVAEAAAVLQVDERTVRRAIAAGTFPAVRVQSATRIPVARFMAHCGLTDHDAPPGAAA